jgi:hypothetical protein
MAPGRLDFDWLVIGSGFGGSVSALRLAEKGHRVAVLECGRDPARTNRDRHPPARRAGRSRRLRGDARTVGCLALSRSPRPDGRWCRRGAGALGTNRLLFSCKLRGSLPDISDRLGYLVRTNSESILAVTAPDDTRDFTRGVAITSSIYPIRTRASNPSPMAPAPIPNLCCTRDRAHTDRSQPIVQKLAVGLTRLASLYR